MLLRVINLNSDLGCCSLISNPRRPYSHNPDSYLAKISAIVLSQDLKEPVTVAIITAMNQTSILQSM